MAEFYFEDMDAFECFYDSKEFQRLTAHGSEFIGSVDTYLVETHPVVARVGAREGTAYRLIMRDGPTARFLGGGLSVLKRSEGLSRLAPVSTAPLAPSCPQNGSYDKVCFGELGFASGWNS